MDEIDEICKRRTERRFLGRRNFLLVVLQFLLNADDIVLIADIEKLQQVVEEWNEELHRKSMIICTTKSKIKGHRVQKDWTNKIGRVV